jgi:hypothetical protein
LKNYDDIFEKFLFDILDKEEEQINLELINLIEKIGLEKLKNNILYLELLKFESLKEELINIKNFSSKQINQLNLEELEELEKDIFLQAEKIENLFEDFKETYNYIKDN